jgi:hypothetical protein
MNDGFTGCIDPAMAAARLKTGSPSPSHLDREPAMVRAK